MNLSVVSDTPPLPHAKMAADLASTPLGSMMVSAGSKAMGVPVTPEMVKAGAGYAKQEIAAQEQRQNAEQENKGPRMRG